MKYIILILFLLTAGKTSAQQLGMTILEAKIAGINTAQLDSFYPSAMGPDTNVAVFRNKQEIFYAEFVKLLQEIGNKLHEKNFKWEQETRTTVIIYFNKTGQIDYFLYSFQTDHLTDNQRSEFNKTLNEVLKYYKLNITGKGKYSQCGPVVFKDKS